MNFKNIPEYYFSTIVDRLSRFEPAYVRYKRVFDDIINKFLLDDKLKNLSFDEQLDVVKNIINASTSNNFNFELNDCLIKIENNTFVYNELSYQYLSCRLNLYGILEKIVIQSSTPKNVIWLKNIYKSTNELIKKRSELGLLFPIEKIILCEGQTEFLLLDTIFSLYGISFDKLGVMVIPAGGKNQVARKYYELIENVKIPIFILLDKDAELIKSLIINKIRTIDSLYLINSGEFEDLIPTSILNNAINSYHKNEYNCSIQDFEANLTMVSNLELIYKKYGFGEFKKAKFAQTLKDYISAHCTKDDFLLSEIPNIIESFNSLNSQTLNLK